MSAKKEVATATTEQAQFEVDSVVICDDIRREANGKAILIGVYDGIVVPDFPADLLLSCWLQLKVTKPGPIILSARLIGPHDVIFGEAATPADIPVVGLVSFVFGGMYAPLQLPGSLKLQIKYGNNDWSTIKALDVKKMQLKS